MTIFAKSTVILMQFENFCISLHVSVSSFSKFWHFQRVWFCFDFFCELLFFLGNMLAFRVLLKAHFRAPQNCKSWALVRTRAQFSQFSKTFFLHLFFVKNIKKQLSPAPELNFCGPVPLKNQFSAFALSFAILWFLPHPNRIWGGYMRPETLRTAPHRRTVMGIGLTKNRWEKQKSRPSVSYTHLRAH